jgi:hypothetical protein
MRGQGIRSARPKNAVIMRIRVLHAAPESTHFSDPTALVCSCGLPSILAKASSFRTIENSQPILSSGGEEIPSVGLGLISAAGAQNTSEDTCPYPSPTLPWMLTLPAVVPVAAAGAAVAVGVSGTVPALSASPPWQAQRVAVLHPTVSPRCSLVSSGAAAEALLPA